MPRKVVAADESDGISDYDLPKTIVTKIAKHALPADVKMQRDIPVALQKGSTVFVNYLAAVAHDVATDKGNKTIAATHVLEAVTQLGWEDDQELVKHLKKELAAFRAGVEAKKLEKHGVKPPTTKSGAGPGRPPAPADKDKSAKSKSDDAPNSRGSRPASVDGGGSDGGADEQPYQGGESDDDVYDEPEESEEDDPAEGEGDDGPGEDAMDTDVALGDDAVPDSEKD